MYSIQLQKEKKNQPMVNTVQFWSKNYSCSFFLNDDYFSLRVPRISLGNKNQILVNTVQKKKPKNTTLEQVSFVTASKTLQIRPQIIKRFDLLKKKSLC